MPWHCLNVEDKRISLTKGLILTVNEWYVSSRVGLYTCFVLCLPSSFYLGGPVSKWPMSS